MGGVVGPCDEFLRQSGTGGIEDEADLVEVAPWAIEKTARAGRAGSPGPALTVTSRLLIGRG